MKILQVNKFYDPVIGGVETVCKQYSEHLEKEHEVTVLCAKNSFNMFTTITYINNVKVIRCSSLGTLLSMPISFSFFFHFLYNFLKSEVIFLHLPCPLIDLALCFVPMINRKVFVVWHSEIVRQRKLRRVLTPLFLNTLNRANKILVTSPNQIKFSKLLPQFEHKCFVLPLSVNCQQVVDNINVPKSLFSIDEGEIDALFLGRLASYKGVKVLLEAILLMAEGGSIPKVVIAGRGELGKYVNEFINTHNLKNITFLNKFVSEEEKFFLMKKSKCFLFPSTESSEAFGITQLEAMLLGTPVINTNLESGVPWVSLNNISGITVSPESPEELSIAMGTLINNEQLRVKLSKGAIRRVTTMFDDKIILKKLERLIC